MKKLVFDKNSNQLPRFNQLLDASKITVESINSICKKKEVYKPIKNSEYYESEHYYDYLEDGEKGHSKGTILKDTLIYSILDENIDELAEGLPTTKIILEFDDALKGHRTHAPAKKRTPCVKVNIRKMF